MTCPSCSAENDAGRTFCKSCGAQLAERAPKAMVTAGNMDDVQQVELARIPTALHAPTTWTIAKGVFLGLLLWAIVSAVVGGALFAALFASATDDDAGEVLRLDDSGDVPQAEPPTSTAMAPLGFGGNGGSYDQCEALFNAKAASGVGESKFISDCLTGDLTEAHVRP